MKLFKKLGVCFLSLAFIVSAGITFASCGKKTNETKIMNLSVNPSLEFVVSSENIVLSVTANNEDGVYILQKYSDFVGMEADEAALKFLQLAEEYGFVVEGYADNATFKISISGEEANKLYESVKKEINSKAFELGIDISNLDHITEEELEDMVAECYQEYTNEQITDMCEQDLVNKIKSSRNETKHILTKEERLSYYRDRALTAIETKIDMINKYLDTQATSAEKLKTQITATVMNASFEAVEEIYSTIENAINDLEDYVQTKLSNYISEKQQYLAAVEAYREYLIENPDVAVNDETLLELEATMESLKEIADGYKIEIENERNSVLTSLKNIIELTLSASLEILNESIDKVLQDIEFNYSQLSLKTQSELESLLNDYKSQSVNPWENN